MTERIDTGWWLQEPPDFYDAVPEPAEVESYTYRDLLNPSQPADLFKDVRVKDDGSFKVPLQFIRTPTEDIWCFEASGKVKHFKNRDEYGEIRFFQTDQRVEQPIWVPHLYPFEETDDRGLPMIRDRERCALSIRLTKVTGEKVYPVWTELSLNGQNYGADPNMLTIQDGFTFNEFVAIDKQLIAEDVEYPEVRWRRLVDYLIDKNRLEDYDDIILGNTMIPQEYLDDSPSSRPLDWQSRQVTTRLTGKAFGSIWIAIDDLRRGLDAQILFSCLNGNSEI